MPSLSDLQDKLLVKLRGWLETAVTMLPNAVLALVVVVVAGFLSRYVHKAVQRVMHRVTHNEQISDLLGTTARVAVMGLAVFFALGLLELDRTVTSLLAGVGVVGLALGFAFQDIAANFMAGFMMAARRPFAVGDLVKVAGEFGKVERVALRATELQTNDGLWVLIPNKDVFQAPIINYTRTKSRRVEFDVGVAYHHDMTTVRSVVVEALEGLVLRDHERDVEVFYIEFGDSSIVFKVRIWLVEPDQFNYHVARSEAMISIKKAFDREGISIPFPIRTLDFGAATVGGETLTPSMLRAVAGVDDDDDDAGLTEATSAGSPPSPPPASAG